MIQDILNLLKFKPEPIEYYQKYSLKISIGLMVFIGVVYGLLLPRPIDVGLAGHFLLMLMGVPTILATGLFLQVFLKIKGKKPTFQALFALIALSSMIDLLAALLAFLAQFNGIFDYLLLVVFCYSFLVFLFAFAKANQVGLGFSLLSMLLGSVVLTILLIITSVAFVAIGLMPAPVLPPPA